MRVVEQIGDSKHITLAVWPKEETPKHQLGPGNSYYAYLTSTQANSYFRNTHAHALTVISKVRRVGAEGH